MRLIAALLALLTATPLPAQTATALLDHVAIVAADQQVSVDFYRGAFGLTEIPAPFGAGGPRWLDLGGGTSLHIQAKRPQIGHFPSPPPSSTHFAIAVADLDRLTAYLDEKKIAWGNLAGEPRKFQTFRTDGIRQIYLQDPDGYWIEVNDKLKGR